MFTRMYLHTVEVLDTVVAETRSVIVQTTKGSAAALLKVTHNDRPGDFLQFGVMSTHQSGELSLESANSTMKRKTNC